MLEQLSFGPERGVCIFDRQKIVHHFRRPAGFDMSIGKSEIRTVSVSEKQPETGLTGRDLTIKTEITAFVHKRI